MNVRIGHQFQGQVLKYIARGDLPDPMLIFDDLLPVDAEKNGFALLIPHKGIRNRLLPAGYKAGEILGLGFKRDGFLVDFALDPAQPGLKLKDFVIGDQNRMLEAALLDFIQNMMVDLLGILGGNFSRVQDLVMVRIF